MNDQYREIHQTADRLWHRFQDKVDNPDAPGMQSLREQMKEIVQVVESQKDPRNIEDHIKQVQRVLQDVKSRGEDAMTSNDADELYDDYEDLRRDVRELPHY